MPSENSSKLTLEPGKGTSQSSPNAGAASAIAALGGKPLGANRGTSLNLDWIDQVRVNTSAVERRAATLVTRRTVKRDWQIAWLLRAITCMDLTTLSGDDTDERVRRLSAKARQPLRQELVEKLGIGELNIKVGAVCVYHLFVETARGGCVDGISGWTFTAGGASCGDSQVGGGGSAGNRRGDYARACFWRTVAEVI